MADTQIPSDPPPQYSADSLTAPSSTGDAKKAATPDGGGGAAASRALLAAGGGGLRKPLPLMDLPILTHLRARRVILASASPRRKHLLAQAGLPSVEIWPSQLPEDLPKELYGPFEYVAATARRKCMDVYQEVLAAQEEAAASSALPPTANADPELVIAADTVVVSRSGRILEKPRSHTDHIQMLRHLRDTHVHQVLTAVCVLSPRQDAAHPGYAMAAHTEETQVSFARESDGLSDEVLEAYVRTREGADKAGGYALQGTGGLMLVERIEGSVDNVIGLPVRRLLQLAEKVIFKQNLFEDEAEGSGEEE